MSYEVGSNVLVVTSDIRLPGGVFHSGRIIAKAGDYYQVDIPYKSFWRRRVLQVWVNESGIRGTVYNLHDEIEALEKLWRRA